MPAACWSSPTTWSCSTGPSPRCSTWPMGGSTSTRGPTPATASSSPPTRPSASGPPPWRDARSSGSPPWPTPCGVRPSVGPGSPRRSTSGSNGWKGSGPRSSPSERKSTFRLPVPRRSAAVPLAVRQLAVRYGEDTVLSAVDFHAGRGDRIVVIGRNGAGKSSLLRCLAGVQEPSEGEVAIGVNVAIGYFAQEHEQVDLSVTALENVDDSVLRTDAERRGLLGSFGLPSKAADQMPATLSGGERAKLGLAMLAAGRANLLDPGRADQQPGSALHRRGGADARAVAGDHRRGEPRPVVRRGPRPHPRPASFRASAMTSGARSTSTTWRCARKGAWDCWRWSGGGVDGGLHLRRRVAGRARGAPTSWCCRRPPPTSDRSAGSWRRRSGSRDWAPKWKG